MRKVVQITEEFCEVANPALDRLKKDTGKECNILYKHPNGKGDGTLELHIIFGTLREVLYNKKHIDTFFKTLCDNGYLRSNPTYGTADLRSGTVQTVRAWLQNLKTKTVETNS